MVTSIADVIVTGKILNVSGRSYTFSVDQTIKGSSQKQITVKMFREWMCDMRRKKAAPGQELLLFLTITNKDSFDIINGSTGEIFITGDSATRLGYLQKAYPLTELLTALRDYLCSYQMIFSKPYYSDPIAIQIKTDAVILAFRNRSSCAEWIFGEMKDYHVVKRMDPGISKTDRKFRKPSVQATS